MRKNGFAILSRPSRAPRDAYHGYIRLRLRQSFNAVLEIHQPLHAGYADDRGGNQYQLQAFMRGTNLHALWDSGMIKRLSESPESMAARLIRTTSSDAKIGVSAAFAEQESCQVVGTAGFYPNRRVGSDYIDRFIPVAEARLLLARRRLGDLLNTTLNRDK